MPDKYGDATSKCIKMRPAKNFLMGIAGCDAQKRDVWSLVPYIKLSVNRHNFLFILHLNF